MQRLYHRQQCPQFPLGTDGQRRDAPPGRLYNFEMDPGTLGAAE